MMVLRLFLMPSAAAVDSDGGSRRHERVCKFLGLLGFRSALPCVAQTAGCFNVCRD
jgi:hypothetical protein